jgi:hypothetical protein
MSSAWTSGRPALIIVANWRVKMTMSRVLILPPAFFLPRSSSTFTTMSFCRRSCATTSSRVLASIVDDLRSPLRVRAVYANVGIEPPL